MSKIAEAVVTLFYLGRFPYLPGTLGSAAALVLVGLFRLMPGRSGDLLLLFILASAGTALVDFHPSLAENGDPRDIVIDEAAGMTVACFMVPFEPLSIAVAFVLFRITDILKPPPLKKLEKLPGAAGVMADDIGAGLIANLLTLLIVGLM